MSEDEALLRDNLLDALDRLYDQECRVIDMYALLEATRVALPPSDLAAVLTDAADALAVLIRLGRPEIEMNFAALVITHPVRHKVAAEWQPSIARSHDPAMGIAVAAGLLRGAADESRKFGHDDDAVLFAAVADELSR